MFCDPDPVIDPITALSSRWIEEDRSSDGEKLSLGAKSDGEFFDELHPDRSRLLPRRGAILEGESLKIEIDAIEVLRADEIHDRGNSLRALFRLREDLLEFEFLSAIGQCGDEEITGASQLCQWCVHGDAGISALVEIEYPVWTFKCVPKEHHLADEVVVIERCRH